MDGIETFQWRQLAKQQKFYVIVAAVILVLILGALAWDSLRLRSEIHGYENQAIEARRDKEEALTKAANVASELRKKEAEQNKTEGKRDAKADEAKQARSDVNSARAEYDRSRVSRRPDIPSAEQLCRELAAAGHPCQPQ